MFNSKKKIYNLSMRKILILALVVFLVIGATGCQSILTSVVDQYRQPDAADLQPEEQDALEVSETELESETKAETTAAESSTISSRTSSAETRSAGDSIASSKSDQDALIKNPNSNSANLPSSKISGHLKVHYIDVGQGDSIFVELPNKQTMLIDAGEKANGNQIVSYIKTLGYDTVDYVVATHPHADHIGGMANVINSLSVGKFYMPDKEHTTKTFENMIDALIANEVDVYRAKTGVDIINIKD